MKFSRLALHLGLLALMPLGLSVSTLSFCSRCCGDEIEQTVAEGPVVKAAAVVKPVVKPSGPALAPATLGPALPTNSAAVKPAVKPAVLKPVESKPVESKPVESKPVGLKPAESKSTETLTNRLRTAESESGTEKIRNVLRESDETAAATEPSVAKKSTLTKRPTTVPVEPEQVADPETDETPAAADVPPKAEGNDVGVVKSSTPRMSVAPKISVPPAAAATPAAAKPAPSAVSPTAPSAASPTASPAATSRAPSVLLAPGEEPPSKKMAVGTQPPDDDQKKLFASQEDAKPLTPELENLRRRVQTALATFYRNWTLNTREHSPWEVMHAIIAYGVDTRLIHNGRMTTAIGHMCYSGICEHQQIVTLREGKIYVHRGPGVQGHSGQFLAILAQSHLQRDYPMYIGGQQYTLEDLIKAEQNDCESDTELTFKLIGLMHYLPSDATWQNFQGQTWSLDRLVREEIVQPIRGAACGGTHRLMGLSYAVRKRAQRGEPIDGIYLEAKKYIEQYHKYTFGLQNSDGSFSTAWFVRREARIDLDRRLQTTGHILEWLCFSLSDEQLRDPRVIRSVKFVTDQLLNETGHEWEVGHLGHALHALQLYNERVFGGPMRSYESLVNRPEAKPAR